MRLEAAVVLALDTVQEPKRRLSGGAKYMVPKLGRHTEIPVHVPKVMLGVRPFAVVQVRDVLWMPSMARVMHDHVAEITKHQSRRKPTRRKESRSPPKGRKAAETEQRQTEPSRRAHRC